MPPTFAILIPLLIALAGCDLFGGGDSLRVNAIPTSAVEMALDIRTTKGGSVRITRDGLNVATFNLSGKDTIYIDSGLSPTTIYSWRVRSGGESVGVRAATMDTTSSQFIWRTFTFGSDINSSVLYDVAIINEDNIWAVGEIYVRDDEHVNGYEQYNAVHWDGVEWTLKQIPFRGFPAPGCGAVVIPPIRAIWHFSDRDIWFAAGGSLVHFYGENYSNDCRMNSLLTGGINKVWGASSKDLYIVGGNGSLAHYDGTTWLKLVSGTSLNINDIWGGRNTGNGKWEILAVAYNPLTLDGREILRIGETAVIRVSNDGLPDDLSTIWFVPGAKYVTAGAGLYQSWGLSTPWRRDLRLPSYHVQKARGTGLNDIAIAGSFGMLMHYNGMEWKPMPGEPIAHRGFSGLALHQNLLVATGGEGSKALVVVGERH